MAKKKLYDENGNEVKAKGGCLKWFGIAILVIIAISLLGSLLGGEDTETNTITAEPQSSSESLAKSEDDISNEPVEEPEINAQNVDEQYQAILDDYTLKIKEAAPRLVEEYNNEYPSNQDGLEGLAELSNEKIGDLAEISNEGVGEMADVYYSSGSGKYEEYEEWAGKLMDVYMQEAGQITDAYMNSAQ